MAWTTPTLVEICIGLEINRYLPAEFAPAKSLLTGAWIDLTSMALVGSVAATPVQNERNRIGLSSFASCCRTIAAPVLH